ncbi:MAG: glycosyltransferase family 2 protein [Treponemataceae bacterium]
MNKKISIVVPIMNEEGNIRLLYEKIITTITVLDFDYEIIFVDDGSKDETLSIIKKIAIENSNIKFLSFARNFGHQNALKAGIDFSTGDCVISLDGDLQHPPELIPQLIKKWQEGFEIVYTVRQEDPKLSFVKKMTSKSFYSLMNSMSDVKIEAGSADFRLIDKSVADVIKNLNENPIFFRGMIRWLGFKQAAISYMPAERFWGKSKYSMKKMINFAVSGITSFSIKPLQLSTFLGSFIAGLSFLYAIYALCIKIFTNNSIQGWSSLLILVAFLGGIQLLFLGILGEYIGKMFIDSKRRPSYIIRETNI